ncbi:hypothetical protein [Bacteroides congonensis]|jgi:thymidylate kinase
MENSYSTLFLYSFFDLLNCNCEYAVLRNFDGLPDKNTSRDIDIVINKSAYKTIKPKLIELINQFGWKIITLLVSDRLITWVCGHIDKEGNVDVIQFDFFYHTSVFGIYLLSADEYLQSREFNGKLYHVSKEYEFLDKYLYDRAVGVAYPDKYYSIRQIVEKNRNVLYAVKRIFGSKTLVECDTTSSRKLLTRVLMKNLMRSPITTIGRLIRFDFYHVKNYIYSNTGFSLGFTGPDGSGKTTVIDLMIERLGGVFHKAHYYYHFRPQLFGNLGEVAYSTGIKKEVDRNYNEPHRGEKTGKLSSITRLIYYSQDYIWGYLLKVKTVTRITRLVVFDRYYTDIIVDSRRSRIYLNYKFLYWFGRLFIPSLDYNILLTADSEVILKRKQELDSEGICSINEKIEYLSTKKGYSKVLNESTPENAVEKILSYIFEQQHQKNLKRLK